MKTQFILLFLYLFVQHSYSQDFNKVYFNSNWEITSQNSATYYRTSDFNDRLLTYDGKITDYYKDGNIEMTGQYEKGFKEGEFTYYDKDGNIIFESSYHQGKRTGIWTEFYTNGKIKRQVKYENDREKLIAINDENGKNKIREGSSRYSTNYFYNSQFESYTYEPADNGGVKYYLNGKLLNGFKNGIWVLKSKYRTICTTKYDNGALIKGEYFLYDGSKIKMESDIFTYLILEPAKIIITENFNKEPGQLIRLNYVLKALKENQNQEVIRVELEEESDLIDFFNSQYSIHVKNCADTFRIFLHLDVDEIGNISVDSISPNIPTSMRNEVHRIINSVSNLKFVRNKKVNFNYRILCLDELDYKK